MFGALMNRPSRSPARRFFLLFSIGLLDGVLLFAYWPALADSLESHLFVQRVLPPSSSHPPTPSKELIIWDAPGISQPFVFRAEKAALDDDTPVIGVVAGKQARAYLVEAFGHGPGSHLVNDVLGGVPISVTHCDISGCSRVFTSATRGKPLDLLVGGRKDSRLLLKYGGHLYRQETSELLDEAGAAFPYPEHPMALMSWGKWRQAHPQTDVYMGTIEEATPPEAGGPHLYMLQKLCVHDNIRPAQVLPK